jgi:hypothetical protein
MHWPPVQGINDALISSKPSWAVEMPTADDRVSS